MSAMGDTDTASYEENQEERRVVALTFDDGPHPVITPKVLEVLKEKKVKATFFVIGEQAEIYPDVLKRLSEQGHEIGNHTYSHVSLCAISEQTAYEEVAKASQVIEEIIGKEVSLLRPPYGKYNKQLDLSKYLNVGWNVDTLDWTKASVDAILTRVKKQVKPGAIILMHDQYENTAISLPYIIDWLIEEGYEIVSIEEMLLE